ncbi:MAG: M48 family metallopeptidase [Phycisphaerales bacterium]|nr:M48 family metallopeptidase [Phycisphaerales bacterium]
MMLMLGGLVGAALGAVAAAYGRGAARPEDLLPSVVLGLVAAVIVGGLGAMWSWFSGSDAILRMMGARQVGQRDDPELYNVVDEMRIAAGLPMPRVYLIDDTALNAFATGRDPEHAVVAVTKGLRAMLPRDELQAVVAHEMSHVRHLDIRFAMLMATMVGLIVFACDAFRRIIWYSGGRGGSGRRSSGKDGGGVVVVVIFVVAIVLMIIAPIFARIIQMAYSREREYLADAGAVELTRDPEALARALARIAGDREPLVEVANRGTAHMFIANPLKKARAAGQSIDSLFTSHPPMEKRIARILALTR